MKINSMTENIRPMSTALVHEWCLTFSRERLDRILKEISGCRRGHRWSLSLGFKTEFLKKLTHLSVRALQAKQNIYTNNSVEADLPLQRILVTACIMGHPTGA